DVCSADLCYQVGLALSTKLRGGLHGENKLQKPDFNSPVPSSNLSVLTEIPSGDRHMQWQREREREREKRATGNEGERERERGREGEREREREREGGAEDETAVGREEAT